MATQDDGCRSRRSKLPDGERKRRKAARARERRMESVYLGEYAERWKSLSSRLQLDSEELAVTLMDYYEEHRNCLLVSSTPTRENAKKKFLTTQSQRSEDELSSIAPLDDNFEMIEVAADLTEEFMISDLPSSPSTLPDAGEDDDPEDPTWEPTLESIHLDDDELLHDDQPENCPEDVVVDIDFNRPDGIEDEEEDECTKPITGRGNYIRLNNPEELSVAEKAVAFESCLLQLANFKPPSECKVKGCQSPVQVHSQKKGTAMFLHWKCGNNHTVKSWCSQPKLPRGILAGDFGLAACILLSGNNFKKVSLMMNFFNLGCVNASSFFRIQSLYCCPAIDNYWNNILEKNIQEAKNKEVVIAGDGRMDSPGFSAKFCTYTVMDADNLNILAMEVIDKRQTDLKSPNMETKGFKDALVKLEAKGIKIAEVVTDGHPSITAFMKKKPEIKHSYDVWHGAKNLAKKLTAAASYKATMDLLPWRGDIVGHFWYSCQKANGSPIAIRNKWKEVLHHIIDEHEWIFGECDHQPILTPDKPYLTPGSPAHKALTDIVLDEIFMTKMDYYVNYRSTAELEGFQNHILMYAGKRFAYCYPTYKARCQLAAIDYQLHKGRPVLTTKDGEEVWYRQYMKNSARWSAFQKKENKTYAYIPDILADIFKRRIDDSGRIARRVELLDDDPRLIAPTIARVPPPPTKDLALARKSRFNKGPELHGDIS